MNRKMIIEGLNKMVPNPKCELVYKKDYELLISTMLSAQSTDKRVNEVTKLLYKYDIKELANLDIKAIEEIIKPVGTYHKKAVFIKAITNSLLDNYKGAVPCNRYYLESLPGVGRKTTNVVLANIYNEPHIAVDTHVSRVSKILGLVKDEDDVITIEKKLNAFFPEKLWNRINDQLILFGRYTCKAKNPDCENCVFKQICQKKI